MVTGRENGEVCEAMGEPEGYTDGRGGSSQVRKEGGGEKRVHGGIYMYTVPLECTSFVQRGRGSPYGRVPGCCQNSELV